MNMIFNILSLLAILWAAKIHWDGDYPQALSFAVISYLLLQAVFQLVAGVPVQ